MADVKKLQTRIALKYDTYANWTDTTLGDDKGANLVLLKGEIGICEIPSVNTASNVAPTVLFKVGDGTKKFSELPWASAKAADVYSWAKASDVELEGKTIKFVGTDKTITLNYVTEAEVKAITDPLDARITKIESSIGNGGDIAGQVAGLTTRIGEAEQDIVDLGNNKLDKSTYETYIFGKSMSDAELKKYAEDEADAAQSAAEATAASALSTAKGALEAADTALGGRIDGVSNRVAAFEGENGLVATGDAATLEAAKGYTNDRETLIRSELKTAYEGYADGVAATAKSGAISEAKGYTDTEVGEVSAALDAHKNNKENPHEVTKAQVGLGNVENKSTATIKSEFTGSIADGNDGFVTGDAVYDAIEAAKTAAANDAAGKVNTLANGAVKTNTENIGKNAAEISRVEGLVSTEKSRAEGVESGLNTRLEAVEAFFETAEGETLDTALDTLKEIQDYLNGEGNATDGIIGRVAQAETDIDNLEKEFNTDTGRVKVAEGKISALEAEDARLAGVIDTKLTATDFTGWKATHESDHAKTATKITEEITTAVSGEKSAREAADAAIEEKIGGSYSKTSTVADAISAVSTVANRADTKSIANAGRLDTAEEKITALETASAKHAEKTYVDEELGKKVNVSDYNTAIGNVYTKTEADGKFALITTVNTNTENIGKNAAAIDKVAGDLATEVTNRGTAITNATNSITSAYQAADLAINNKIGTVTEGKTVVGLIGEAQAAAEGKVTALANGQVETNRAAIAKNAADITALDGRVDAIEEKFMGWFVIDCGSATTVIDETK